MSLSRALVGVILTNPCPHCGHNLEMKGSWFQAVSNYRCKSCEQKVRLAYEDKLRLFDAHADLTGS